MVYEYNGTNTTGGTAYYYGLTLISQGNCAYYIYNGHGDVVQLITAASILGRSYDYDAFGNEVSPSAIDTNPFRYAGQYFDSETGTYYLRARYYAPGIGRFTQRVSAFNEKLSFRTREFSSRKDTPNCQWSGSSILFVISSCMGKCGSIDHGK